MTKSSVSRLERKQILPRAKIAAPEGAPFKLDIGCGQRKQPGHIGIDIGEAPGVDHVMDVREYPWPIEDGAVDEIYCSHFFEHLTGKERVFFMNECHRVMKVGAKMLIIVPHWSNERAYGDPTHEWPPVNGWTFLYYNLAWREANLLTHGFYANIVCDFDHVGGFSLAPDLNARHADYVQRAMLYDINAITDMHVTLTKKPPPAPPAAT